MTVLYVALDVYQHYNYRYPVPELAFQRLYVRDKLTSVIANIKYKDSEEYSHEYPDNQESNIGYIFITKTKH